MAVIKNFERLVQTARVLVGALILFGTLVAENPNSLQGIHSNTMKRRVFLSSIFLLAGVLTAEGIHAQTQESIQASAPKIKIHTILVDVLMVGWFITWNLKISGSAVHRRLLQIRDGAVS